jgi:hypothetical protein
MSLWEYDKIDLNSLPRKTDDLDVLNDAGKEGWELVIITGNNIAFVKGPVDAPKRPAKGAAKCVGASATPTRIGRDAACAAFTRMEE